MTTPRRTTTTAALCAMSLALAIVLLRSMLVVWAHSPTWDEQYHLWRGLLLTASPERTEWNDPPTVEAVLAFPLWALDLAPDAAHLKQPLRYGQASTQTLQWIIAAWKSLLLLPLLAVAFVWTRELYGTAAGWLALGLIVFEPTLAAVTPLATPDSLGVTGITVAMYLAWRAARYPTNVNLAIAGVGCSVGVLLKHTAVIAPLAAGAFMAIYWIAQREKSAEISIGRLIFRRLAMMWLVSAASLWVMTGLDWSRPDQWGRHLSAEYDDGWSIRTDVINPAMMRPMPAGMYFGSLAEAYSHGEEGHLAYLAGRTSYRGWWYYFPVVGSYKVPIGFAAILLVAMLCLRRSFSAGDAWLIGAGAIWLVFVASSGINIGFRHALPGYILLLIASSRLLLRDQAKWVRAAAVIAFAAGAVHVLAAHPDYLSYINRPDDRAYLVISDSNVDWGQSLKQLRRWAENRDQTLSVVYFGDPQTPWVQVYLGDRAMEIEPGELPESGLLAVSAALEPRHSAYRMLRSQQPVAVLGDGAMRLYAMPAAAGN